MPLFRGKSKKAFEHNISEEMDAGKPQKQSLAIAYAIKRRDAEKEACGGMMAEGGMIQSSCTEDCVQPCAVHEKASGYEPEGDMVDRIMSKREKMYSDGGMVANGGEDDLDKLAGGRPNEFDDLALRDDLESSYCAENSGDELGNETQNHDREDIVSRIMRSRAKRDRNPRPA